MNNSNDNRRMILQSNWKLGLAVVGIVAAGVAVDAIAGQLSFSDDNRNCFFCEEVVNHGSCNHNNADSEVNCSAGNHAVCELDADGNLAAGATCAPDSLTVQ